MKRQQTENTEYWMRPLSFLGLFKIIQIFIEYPSGIRAKDLDSEISNRRLYVTARGTAASRTTLYHCRNTLVRLGVIVRHNNKFMLNTNDKNVASIVSEMGANGLSVTIRDAFGKLVFNNKDCYKHFFQMFTANVPSTFENFRENGCSITWKWDQNDNKNPLVSFSRNDLVVSVLSTPSQIKCILYGLRYWAKNELNLIDEYFREDRQNIIYPLRSYSLPRIKQEMLSQIMAKVIDRDEWTVLSIQDLITDICEKGHLPISELFSAITLLAVNNPGYVVFIPTSGRIASLTAGTRATEDLRLKSYYQDQQGRYISHMRIHNEIRKGRS